MNNRRKFLAAGGAPGLYRRAGSQGRFTTNDWLIRLDTKVEVPIGSARPPAVQGLATLGDDFHDPVGSHADIHEP